MKKTLWTLLTCMILSGCDSEEVVPLPEAQFTINYTGKPAPNSGSRQLLIDIHQNILLFNRSEDAVRYEWYFGDGNKSYDANPTHSYSEYGSFLVTLKAFNKLDEVSETATEITVGKRYLDGIWLMASSNSLKNNAQFQFGEVNEPTGLFYYAIFPRYVGNENLPWGGKLKLGNVKLNEKKWYCMLIENNNVVFYSEFIPSAMIGIERDHDLGFFFLDNYQNIDGSTTYDHSVKFGYLLR